MDNEINARLRIMKNFIILSEDDDILRCIKKLETYLPNSELNEILISANEKNFKYCIKQIDIYLSPKNNIRTYLDPNVVKLKNEIIRLEEVINSTRNEKVEIENLLSEFQYHQDKELGQLIINILEAKKIFYKNNKAKFEETETYERSYKSNYFKNKEKIVYDLDYFRKSELKKNFRKATTLCHPDKFFHESSKTQKKAEEIFKELNTANSQNDLEAVNNILERLTSGILSTDGLSKTSDVNLLKQNMNQLALKLKGLRIEVNNLKNSDSYKLVVSIKNWNSYFAKQKAKLIIELDDLIGRIKKAGNTR